MTNPKQHPLSLSFHPPHFLHQHWHSGVWRKPVRQERVSSQLWWGWGLAVPREKQQWMALFFSVHLHGLPSVWAGSVGYEGSVVGVCMCRGGCHLAITQSAKYNITTVVELCGLCVCSVPLRRKGLFSFPSLPCLYPTRNTLPSSHISPVETRVPELRH